ncbi:MAG: type II toxin-antitoxin system VapC family toxin [Opitutales bacterium]|nr:type II toxin-antitoxin system VapC family toxin [Opitutales bacterium]
MILLDTHTFVWWVSDRNQLSKAARAALEDETSQLHLSVVSAWEIALLQKKNRLRLPVPVPDFMQRGLARHGIHELPLLRRTVLTAVNLPDIHNDPFDRILVAEAIQGRLTIVTKDSVIPEYPDAITIW